MMAYDQATRDAVVEYYISGHSGPEIKKKFGVSHEIIAVWVRKAGHEMRRRGQNNIIYPGTSLNGK
jgi:transposase